MKLRYDTSAWDEVLEVTNWYKARSHSLAERFLAAFDYAIGQIMDSPDRWAYDFDMVRRYMVNQFPYSIYYGVISDEIIIFAIAHHSRKPSYWRSRIPH